jgi:uncharacterized membrane protein
LLLLHIIAAITWVGGAITINFLATQVWRARDETMLTVFLRQTEWTGKSIFPISAIAVLALGISMVAANEAWTVGQLWIVLALVGVGITLIGGAAFFGPDSARIGQLVQERGAGDPEVRSRIRRVMLVSRLDLLLLLLIVADMVIKPGL